MNNKKKASNILLRSFSSFQKRLFSEMNERAIQNWMTLYGAFCCCYCFEFFVVVVHSISFSLWYLLMLTILLCVIQVNKRLHYEIIDERMLHSICVRYHSTQNAMKTNGNEKLQRKERIEKMSEVYNERKSNLEWKWEREEERMKTLQALARNLIYLCCKIKRIYGNNNSDNGFSTGQLKRHRNKN